MIELAPDEATDEPLATHVFELGCYSETWTAWSRPEREYEGERYIWSPAPLFAHQFSHAWFDFQNRPDAGIDWFANSVAESAGLLESV